MRKGILIVVSGILLLGACKKNDAPDIKPANVSLQVSYAVANDKLPLSEAVVKLSNTNTGSNMQLKADASGKVLFTAVPAGNYDVDVSATIDAVTYNAATGDNVTKPIVFNASRKNWRIVSGETPMLTLQLVTGNVGPWVIKQVYYAGSHRQDGAITRDQFIEIYNNSDEVQYADSIYFGRGWGRQEPDSKGYHEQPVTRQMDWTKSIGMPANINANADYVYLRDLYMIPGTGRQYPVRPGESIVIAQTALNHKTPFVDIDGKSVSVKNPSLTVDLSKADFEAYLAEERKKRGDRPAATDLDNPSVPNLRVLQYAANDMILDNPGRDSYVIFKMKQGADAMTLPQYAEPLIAPAKEPKLFFQVPLSLVIDGVEVQPHIPSDRIPKKLAASVDAGYTFVPKGAYTSQSIIRKTASEENGRRILKDTNNSSEDFDVFDIATPKGFK